MNKILSQAQAGAINERQIQIKLMLNTLVIQDAKEHKNELHMITIDFESAFTNTNKKNLIHVLKKMKFPIEFIKNIEMIIESNEAAIKVNNNISIKFNIVTGTHQGCFLSPVLWVIFLDPLLKYLELQKIGYTFAKNKNFNITVSALVDDISIFANNVQNILTLFNSVENWALYNQVNVNITKTEYVNNYEIIKKKIKKQLKLENAQKKSKKNY